MFHSFSRDLTEGPKSSEMFKSKPHKGATNQHLVKKVIHINALYSRPPPPSPKLYFLDDDTFKEFPGWYHITFHGTKHCKKRLAASKQTSCS